VRCPPFGPTMKIFYRRLYMKRCVFVIFQQELQNSTMFDGLLRFQILEKWANLRFPLNIQKQKVFQLQGGSAPWPPDQGLCQWTPLGAPPPDPRYRLALRALTMASLCQILNTPLPVASAIIQIHILQKFALGKSDMTCVFHLNYGIWQTRR